MLRSDQEASFHHIGIACTNIELKLEDARMFADFGSADIVYDKRRDMRFVFGYICGIGIELIEGNGLGKFTSSSNPYHICVEVNRIHSAVNEIRARGGIVILEPEPAVLFDNRRVAFMYTSVGIVELLERQ